MGISYDSGNNVTVIAGESAVVPFSYTSKADNITVYLTIQYNQTIRIDRHTSEYNGTGEIIILPEDLTDLPLGTYPITLIVQGDPDVLEMENAIMFYEEKIRGLMVRVFLSQLPEVFKQSYSEL